MNEIGIEPDLIRAIGEDGVVGYVRASDLDAVSATCPENVADYLSNLQEQRVLPLYAEDGETVLGSYVIDNTEFCG